MPINRTVFLKDLVRRLRESSDESDVNDGEPKNKGNDFELPTTHRPGMRVPKGGSSCSNCRHFDGQGSCNEPHFAAWQYGEKKIPASPDEYCSDWWEPKGEGDDSGSSHVVHIGPGEDDAA